MLLRDADVNLGQARRASIAAALIADGDVNAVCDENEGTTPLMNAAERGDLITVQRLLADPQIDVNLTDSGGDTALCYAALSGHAGVVAALLNVDGIDVNRSAYGTPVAMAAYWGHIAVVGALLAAPGIDVHDTEFEGRTALENAIDEGHDATAALLRGHGRVTRSMRRRMP